MLVALRADASAQIGTGHLMRCLSLADALKDEGVDTVFVCRRNDRASELIGKHGQACAWLPDAGRPATTGAGEPPHAHWAAAAWEDDAAQTCAVLAPHRPDWTVVDHYALDARWHERVAAGLGTRIAVIDDLADRPLAADLLVDHNLHPDHAAKYLPWFAGRPRLLGGPRYALLSRRYRDAPRYRFRRTVRSVGIFMGGTDPEDFSSRVLTACREGVGFDGSVVMISPPNGPHHALHQRLARRWPDTHVIGGLPDLSGFFAQHDLQIGAGGTAAWERCCVGAPTLALQIAGNQLAVLPPLAGRGAVEWLRADGGWDEHAFARAFRELAGDPRRRLALARQARSLVDGKGSCRVAAVLALAARPALGFRTAQPQDEALLLSWANDPVVRGNAFNPGRISPEHHHEWFQGRLGRPRDCCIVVAVSAAKTPVGQVRFEREGESWLIGFSLDPAFRGWRHGPRLLSGAIDVLRTRFGPVRLQALVKPGNVASLRTFRALGFGERMLDHHAGACHCFELTGM